MHDAIVIGAGPNGLAAAVQIARAGRSVLVLEAADTIGGGARTAELTLPGFRHDVCSAIHPMGAASRLFAELPLQEHGLEWVHPTVPLAHPLDDGSAAVLHRSIDATAQTLGPDADAYRKLMTPFREPVVEGFLAPLLRIPRHPFAMLRLGVHGVRPAESFARSHFTGDAARALFAGNAAHAIMPLDRPPTAAFAIAFAAMAHVHGWPLARGGSQSITNALASFLRSLGGEIECGRRVESFASLPPARAYVFDLSPKVLVQVAGAELPQRYRDKLARYRYGPGVFKIDWALDGPIPWKASECSGAGTVHLGGTLEEIAAGEKAVARGEHPDRPWVIVAQQSVFDDSRAPAGKHTGWAYCHVPAGSTVDMTDVIERQLERFAPGFRDLVLARSTRTPADLESYNPNLVGGDIAMGAASLKQLVARPVLSLNPYATPNPKIFICSSATPPGPAVHGMCGYFAAKSVLRRLS